MVVFHHNDLDGRCAAALLYQKYGDDVLFVECDYKNDVDLSVVAPDESVFIVDYSLKPNVMNKLLSITSDVTWIDHHRTALDYRYAQPLLKGIRDVNFSGCELTWMYLYPDQVVPDFVALIGDMDTWKWEFGERTEHFVAGMMLYSDQSPKSMLWGCLFDNTVVNTAIERGAICVQYRDNFCKEYVDSFGFETTFAGYKAYCLGLAHLGSKVFGDKIKQYDVVATFEYDGKVWTVSLYSEKVDVGALAQRCGGGGHRGAAGYTTKDFPF